MDFQNLGKHCSEPTCRQRDFLPFTCKFCVKPYCLDHRDTTSHACVNGNAGDIKAIICPVCLKTLKYDSSKYTENEYFQLHNASDCDASRYAQVMKERSKRCPVAGCNTRITFMNRYECGKCKQELCLKHRYQDQHVCSKGPYLARDLGLEGKKKVSAVPSKIATGHAATKCDPEICQVCSKSFNSLDELIKHAEKTHFVY